MKDDAISSEMGEGKLLEQGKLSPRKRFIYLSMVIVALLIIMAVIILVDRPSNFDEYIQTSGYTGVLLMAIIGSTSPIWPLPGSWAAFIAGGLGLNLLLIALAAGAGEAIGETTAYMMGYGGQGAISKLSRWRRYRQVEQWTARHGKLAIFLVSAIPNVFTKFIVVAAGALRFPWWKFSLLCFAGKTIKSLGFALAGLGLFNIITRIF